MIECNKCKMKKCTVDYRKMTSKELSWNCPNYIKSQPFKMPMLVHLISNKDNISPLSELLDRFSFNIVESERYPYFKLHLRR